MGWLPRRGIDLRGGVILVYEVEEQTVESEAADPNQAADPRSLTWTGSSRLSVAVSTRAASWR